MTGLRFIAAAEPASMVSVTIDGQRATGRKGEMVAVTLLTSGIRRTGQSAVAATPRGAFCFMGVCQSCLVSVDGRMLRGCTTPLAAGMEILTGSADE